MPTRALRTAASGMNAQQINIQVIANNIANINTNSFKKNRAEFQDLIYQEVATNPQNVEIPGITENTDSTVQIGNGVKASTTQKTFLQGDLQQTGQQLDIAIHGDGFFQVRKSDGTYNYTRDGAFKISGDGTLVTVDGHVVEPGFTIDRDAVGVQITKEGRVSIVDFNGEQVDLGTLDIVRFVNPGGLRALGNNLYAETQESGEPILGTPSQEGFGELHQGFLEASNVDIVEEMVNMITAQRSYEINSKTVKTVEEMMTIANNLKR
jgi:flagellar basal-body rod protein FlgG